MFKYNLNLSNYFIHIFNYFVKYLKFKYVIDLYLGAKYYNYSSVVSNRKKIHNLPKLKTKDIL